MGSASIKVKVGGVYTSVPVRAGVTFNVQLGGRGQGSFTLTQLQGLGIGADVRFYDDSTAVFGGVVVRYKEQIDNSVGPDSHVRYPFTCMGYGFKLDSQQVRGERYASSAASGDILRDLVPLYSTLTTTGVTDGRDLTGIFHDKTLRQILNELTAENPGFFWYITPEGDLVFDELGASTSSLTINPTSAPVARLERTVSRPADWATMLFSGNQTGVTGGDSSTIVAYPHIDELISLAAYDDVGHVGSSTLSTFDIITTQKSRCLRDEVTVVLDTNSFALGQQITLARPQLGVSGTYYVTSIQGAVRADHTWRYTATLVKENAVSLWSDYYEGAGTTLDTDTSQSIVTPVGIAQFARRGAIRSGFYFHLQSLHKWTGEGNGDGVVTDDGWTFIEGLGDTDSWPTMYTAVSADTAEPAASDTGIGTEIGSRSTAWSQAWANQPGVSFPGGGGVDWDNSPGAVRLCVSKHTFASAQTINKIGIFSASSGGDLRGVVKPSPRLKVDADTTLWITWTWKL